MVPCVLVYDLPCVNDYNILMNSFITRSKRRRWVCSKWRTCCLRRMRHQGLFQTDQTLVSLLLRCLQAAPVKGITDASLTLPITHKSCGSSLKQWKFFLKITDQTSWKNEFNYKSHKVVCAFLRHLLGN